MTFTKTPPTTPGFYAWREISDEKPQATADVYLTEAGKLACIIHGRVGFLEDFGGEWCRLVPAEEIEKAWDESRESHITHGGWFAFDFEWKDSRAKRVMEGRE